MAEPKVVLNTMELLNIVKSMDFKPMCGVKKLNEDISFIVSEAEQFYTPLRRFIDGKSDDELLQVVNFFYFGVLARSSASRSEYDPDRSYYTLDRRREECARILREKIGSLESGLSAALKYYKSLK